jgi:hypothetical protein
LFSGQKIRSVQLFNPQTNDETPVIKFGEQLILILMILATAVPFINIRLNIMIGIGKMMVYFLQNMPKEI